MGRQSEGQHGRVFYLDGRFDPGDILRREIRGEHETYSDGKIHSLSGRETGAILVAGRANTYQTKISLTIIVSAQADLRDEIRTLVQDNVNHNVRFLELEYQP